MNYKTSLLLSLAALVVLSLVGCQRSENPPLRVAAASSLKFALDELLVEFRETHPDIPVEVIYGSSGNLRAQIEQGAPFDLFLSADMQFPELLVTTGKADPAALFPYAVGRIVLWVRNESLVDIAKLQELSLLEPSVRKIAIANPQHAPYGQAAVAALKTYGILAQVESKFVLGENIAQAAQFVESGAADIGILALSLAIAPTMTEKGRYWEIPLDTFPPILMGGVILSASKQAESAAILRDAITSPSGGHLLERYGFTLPTEPFRSAP